MIVHNKGMQLFSASCTTVLYTINIRRSLLLCSCNNGSNTNGHGHLLLDWLFDHADSFSISSISTEYFNHMTMERSIITVFAYKKITVITKYMKVGELTPPHHGILAKWGKGT